MKIKLCTCKQCRAKKRAARSTVKKRVKRYLNRLRRRDNDDQVKNWYWA